MKRFLKIVTIVVGFLAVLLIILPLLTADMIPTQEPEEAELGTVQTGINAFMAVNDLFEVTSSTSREGGEKIDGTVGEFHVTLELQPYIRADTTTFCYRWQGDGLIIFQYDVNAEGNCAIDTKQLFP